jgi:hypothetical protein
VGGFVCNGVSGVFANTGFPLLLAEMLLIRGLFRKSFERDSCTLWTLRTISRFVANRRVFFAKQSNSPLLATYARKRGEERG